MTNALKTEVKLILSKGYKGSDNYYFKVDEKALKMVKILATGTNIKLTPSILGANYLNVETYNGTPVSDALKPLITKMMTHTFIDYKFTTAS